MAASAAHLGKLVEELAAGGKARDLRVGEGLARLRRRDPEKPERDFRGAREHDAHHAITHLCGAVALVAQSRNACACGRKSRRIAQNRGSGRDKGRTFSARLPAPGMDGRDGRLSMPPIIAPPPPPVLYVSVGAQ